MPSNNYYPRQPENRQEADAAVEWLEFALKDFPEPVCMWLDERSDDCEHGPHCWSPEIQNDQSTSFEINVAKLGPALGVSLLNACSAVICNDDFDHVDYSPTPDAPIFCSRAYGLTVRFIENSVRQPFAVRFDVYWTLSDEEDYRRARN